MKLKKTKLKTPVLFLIFNRLDTTKKVFIEIKKARPTKIFIAADGPRNKKEKKKTDAVRKYILDNIDWKCELKTLFRQKNLGCKKAVSSAIDWFFDNVDEGIILEDDCLPNQDFFKFCSVLLEKYRDNKKVLHIGGVNFISKKTEKLKESYFFSKISYIWGWATWKRAWKKYNNHKIKIEYRDSINLIDYFMHNKKVSDLKNMNTWDIPWFSMCKSQGLCIVPKKNLVKNLGIGSDSTHTKQNLVDEHYLIRSREKLLFPLIHPKKIVENKELDRVLIRRDFKRALIKKIKLIREIF